jgi:anti-sigma B factor antagonist
MQPNVKMDVRKVNGTTCVVDIVGEINSAAEPVLMEAYNTSCALGARNVLMNFERLQYMNSSGIGLLVTLLIRVRRQNQRLMAFGLNEHYRQIFELTRLNEAISIFETEADAVESTV